MWMLGLWIRSVSLIIPGFSKFDQGILDIQEQVLSLLWETLHLRISVPLPVLGPFLFQLHNCRVWKKSVGWVSAIKEVSDISAWRRRNCNLTLSSCQASLSFSVSGWERSCWTEMIISRPYGSGLSFRKLWVFFLAFLAWLRSLVTFLLVLVLFPKFLLVEFGFPLLSQRRGLNDNFHCPIFSSFSWLSYLYLSITIFSRATSWSQDD